MYKYLEKLYAQPHKIFMCIALFFGIIYIFALPPFAGIDEDHHFARIIALSQGKILDAAILPKYFVNYVDEEGKKVLDFFYFKPYSFFFDIQDIYRAFNDTSNIEPTIFYQYNRAVIYSPVPYISAIPIAFIALKLSLSPIIVLYLVRISIFAASTSIIYYAIKITPLLKWQFLLMALLQTSVLVRSGASADPLTISYIFIFIALILKKVADNKIISKKDFIYLTIISCAICLSKTAYILLPMLFFIIPQHLFTSKAHRIKTLLAMVVLPIMIGSAWFLFSSDQYHSIPTINLNDKYSVSYSKTIGTNEHEQIWFLVNHPINFIKIIFNTFLVDYNWAKMPMQFSTIFGNGQTAFTLPVNFSSFVICALILPLIILFVPRKDLKNNHDINNLGKVLCLSIYTMSFVFICILLYVANTELKDTKIVGLQSRYFIPILPIFLLAIPNIKFSYKSHINLISVMMIFIISLLAYSLYYMLKIYYGLLA